MNLWYDRTFIVTFIINLLLSLPLKGLEKTDNISWSYRQEYSDFFLKGHSLIVFAISYRRLMQLYRLHYSVIHATGFPQVRQNKIPWLFQITLKYFQAFCRAFYNSN